MEISSGVAMICCKDGQSWKLCHGALTADFRAGYSSCSMTNSFVINAVLILMKELWVVDIYANYCGRLHNTWIVGCQIYSKVN